MTVVGHAELVEIPGTWPQPSVTDRHVFLLDDHEIIRRGITPVYATQLREGRATH